MRGSLITRRQFWIFWLAFVLALVGITATLLGRPNIRARYFAKKDISKAAFYHYFLGARLGRNSNKFYLDPKADPTILDSIFPGYRMEIQDDENLWSNYFRRDFETKVTSARLSQEHPSGIVIFQSFTGCFDILRRFGADIIVVGASDLAQSLPPDELAKYYPGKKILMCAAPTLALDATESALQLMNSLYPADRPKPQALIIGVSRTMGFLSSIYYRVLNRTKQDSIDHYRRADFFGRWAYLNQSAQIPFTWNVLYPVRRDANHLPLANRIEHPERWSILDVTANLEELVRDPSIFNLNRLISNQRSAIFNPVEPDPNCSRLRRLPRVLSAVTVEAQKLAENVLIFTTPTMGDELKDAPECYIKMLHTALHGLEGPHVLAYTGEASDFNLSPLDFSFAQSERRPGELTFDVAHVNLAGAKKITNRIARLLRSMEKP